MLFMEIIIRIVMGSLAAFGWLPLLVIGIICIKRKKKKRSGVVLTVIGGVWSLCSLSLVLLVIHFYRQAMMFSEIEDFAPEKHEGEMGSIVVPYKGKSELVLQDRENNKQIRLHTSDGVISVPVGTYDFRNYKAFKADEDNAEWAISGYLFSLKEMRVEPDSRQELDIGFPLTAKVLAKTKGKKKTVFDLKLTGRSGVEYTIFRSGKRTEAPGFQILDKSGEVLWQGKFEYG